MFVKDFKRSKVFILNSLSESKEIKKGIVNAHMPNNIKINLWEISAPILPRLLAIIISLLDITSAQLL